MESESNPLPPARWEHPAAPGVLIIEDEPRLRSSLSRACEQMGYAAATAGSAEEALRGLERGGYGIVLLDLNLPGLDEMGFFERIRSDKRPAEIIILTGYGSLETARRAIALDVSDYLTKPFHLGEIEAALERARRRWAQKQAPALPEKPWTPPEPARATDGPRKLEEIERESILAALERHDGKRSAAAAELGISERTLYYRLRQWSDRSSQARR